MSYKPRFLPVHNRLFPGEASDWPLNEGAGATVTDANFHTNIGQRLTGTFNGTVTWETNYKRGNVARTGGGFIDFADIASPGRKNFSWSIWVNCSTSFGSSFPSIMGRRQAAGSTLSAGWNFGMNTTVGASTFGVPFAEIGDGTTDNGTSGSTADTPVITDGNWHLLVGVVDLTANLVKISVDAKAFATASIAAVTGNIGLAGDGGGFRIGNSKITGTGNFLGLVSDARYEENRSLSLAEIYRIYSEGPSTYRRTSGAIAASTYPFNIQGALGGGAVSSGPISSDPTAHGTFAGTAGTTPATAATAQVLQLAAEVLEKQTASIQVTQLAAEVLTVKSPSLQVSGVWMEVLRSNNGNVLPKLPIPRTRSTR